MRNMRRKDRELPREHTLAVIDECSYSVMATVNPDGSPYCIPLSMAREGDWIYFHSAMEGQKIDNLRFQGKACVCCVGNVMDIPDVFSIGFESAIISGTAGEVTDKDEKIRALTLICKRYTPGNMAAFDNVIEKSLAVTAVWKIHMDEVSGKGK